MCHIQDTRFGSRTPPHRSSRCILQLKPTKQEFESALLCRYRQLFDQDLDQTSTSRTMRLTINFKQSALWLTSVLIPWNRLSHSWKQKNGKQPRPWLKFRILYPVFKTVTIKPRTFMIFFKNLRYGQDVAYGQFLNCLHLVLIKRFPPPRMIALTSQLMR